MVIKIEGRRWRCPYIDHICVLCIFYGDHLSCDFKCTLCRMQNDDPHTYMKTIILNSTIIATITAGSYAVVEEEHQ